MHLITNQTDQPLEISGGVQLPANESLPVEKIGKRERSLEKRGLVTISELSVSEQPATVVAPEKNSSRGARNK
ncbi:MAG TPA: hypothetical protein VF648_00635 [Pyrinomonadaceae bacterium]|jgi:hypothetical protein